MRTLIFTAGLLFTIGSADLLLADMAGAAPAVATDPRQAADIAQIETYLNGLNTAQASFTLTGADGQVNRGTFYLSRPDKLRFDYTDPKGNLLIADGSFVIFWDAQQKESSNLPIGQTPLAFLLKPTVSLSDGSVKITGYEHAAGVIRIRLVQAKDPEAGSVTVAFGDQPLELRGWRLVDGQSGTTDVTFSDWRLGVKLESALFHFQQPGSDKRHR